ncbi:NRAMP metal ion transporter [Phanerochaete sordida]|uniref:NRAMP metal ion transporter n=1 Tax=Phanerochaete sordida TaxID=48140 RepID=A0A9P3LB79_9APHY|nr:NRAMP metal ion transporter [Phanerochaete sordida]
MPPLAEQADGVQAQGQGTENKKRELAVVRGARAVFRHVKHHVGVGIVCSVAYFDPGNWSVDLQAGSEFGYRPLLFVVLLAGLGAIVLQSLACKLGCVTGVDLATHCRLLLHDRPKNRRLVRYAVLYPLYILCEIAIVCTDLAELLGSAIALCMLIPKLPLWAGVALTAADVLVFLVVGGPSRYGKPARMFEITIMLLVLAVFACFILLIVKVHPDWPQAFLGFVPSAKLFDTRSDTLYTAVGILGATVMPHALFLGSFMATQDRVGTTNPTLPPPVQSSDTPDQGFRARLKEWFASLFEVSRAERKALALDYRMKYERENNDVDFIRAHLKHGIVDIVASLMGVAVPINAAILIVAAAVFFVDGTGSMVPAGLFDAYDLIVQHVGHAAGIIFALALLSSGQSSSITATLAGQVVSEGFIEWRVSPFLRRLITRLIGLVPSMVVAIAVGRPGINMLLVASQVALSIVLPFVAFPLIWLTSSRRVMRVKTPRAGRDGARTGSEDAPTLAPTETSSRDGECAADERSAVREIRRVDSIVPEEKTEEVLVETVSASPEEDDYIDFSNGWLLTTVASLIFVIVLAANLYVIVMLALGRE